MGLCGGIWGLVHCFSLKVCEDWLGLYGVIWGYMGLVGLV